MKKVRFSSNKADLQYYISPKKTFPEFEKKTTKSTAMFITTSMSIKLGMYII